MVCDVELAVICHLTAADDLPPCREPHGVIPVDSTTLQPWCCRVSRLLTNTAGDNPKVITGRVSSARECAGVAH